MEGQLTSRRQNRRPYQRVRLRVVSEQSLVVVYAPFYELDTITLGQAELIWTPRLEVVHDQQYGARLCIAGAAFSCHHVSMLTRQTRWRSWSCEVAQRLARPTMVVVY